MGQDMPNIDFSAVKMDSRNEPKFVAANIEHYPGSYFIRRGKGQAQFIETMKLGTLDHLKPSRKRQLAIWVLLPKLAQSFARDYMHEVILSHFEILGKPVLFTWAETAADLHRSSQFPML